MLLSAYHFADFKKKFPATSARPPTELKTTVSTAELYFLS